MAVGQVTAVSALTSCAELRLHSVTLVANELRLQWVTETDALPLKLYYELNCFKETWNICKHFWQHIGYAHIKLVVF